MTTTMTMIIGDVVLVAPRIGNRTDVAENQDVYPRRDQYPPRFFHV